MSFMTQALSILYLSLLCQGSSELYPSHYTEEFKSPLPSEYTNETLQGFFGQPNSLIPKNVNCTAKKICNGGIHCSLICERGTVKTTDWFKFAVATQNKLAYEENICYANLWSTHNSAITAADGYGNTDILFTRFFRLLRFKTPHYRTNNQWISIYDSLNMGVRFIEIDIHWVRDDLRIAHCGGAHIPKFDEVMAKIRSFAKRHNFHPDWFDFDSETLGCFPSLSSIPSGRQKTTFAAFQEILGWLSEEKNKDEFLMIFIDDQSDIRKWDKLQRLLDLVSHFFQDLLYVPTDFEKYGGFLPIKEMKKMGKRLIILSRVDYGPAMSNTMFFKSSVCNWMEPGRYEWKHFTPANKCQGKVEHHAQQSDMGDVLRPQTEELAYGPFQQPSLAHTLNEETLPGLAKCGFNYPSPDSISEERMTATVWSWEKNEPSLANLEQAKSSCFTASLDLKSGRWKAQSCSNPKKLLKVGCREKKNRHNWIISSEPVSFSNATLACPSGFSFVPPLNGRQNNLLYQNALRQKASADSFIWINYRI